MAGQPITLTLPLVGDANPAAANKITAALTALETELERAVVPADMSINADLSFMSGGDSYRAKDLLAASYALQAAALDANTYPYTTYFVGTDMYVNDGSGNQIQVTANGVLNVASSGAITSTGSPAYGESGVEFRWDAADDEYEARAGSGADEYADIRLDDILFNDGSSHFVRLTAGAMSADYTMTLPTAVPGSTSLVTMAATGALATTTAPSLTGATITGAVSSSADVTFSGTAGIKHGDRSIYILGCMFDRESALLDVPTKSNGQLHVNETGTYTCQVLGLPPGARIKDIVKFYYKTSATSASRGFWLKYRDLVGETSTTADSSTESTSAATDRIENLTVSTPLVVSGELVPFIEVDFVLGDELNGVRITYDVP